MTRQRWQCPKCGATADLLQGTKEFAHHCGKSRKLTHFHIVEWCEHRWRFSNSRNIFHCLECGATDEAQGDA